MNKRIFLVMVLTVVLVFSISAQVFAAVEYYSNGNPSKITTDKGTVTYYLSGSVEKIVTPEGTATYNLNGNIDTIDGSPSISLEEAKAMLNNLESQSTNTNSSNLPNTGVNNFYLVLFPIIIVLAAILGYRIYKYKNI